MEIEAQLAEEARARQAQEEALKQAERQLQETKARNKNRRGKFGNQSLFACWNPTSLKCWPSWNVTFLKCDIGKAKKPTAQGISPVDLHTVWEGGNSWWWGVEIAGEAVGGVVRPQQVLWGLTVCLTSFPLADQPDQPTTTTKPRLRLWDFFKPLLSSPEDLPL